MNDDDAPIFNCNRATVEELKKNKQKANEFLLYPQIFFCQTETLFSPMQPLWNQ